MARPPCANHTRHALNSAALAAAREGGKPPSSRAPGASQPASGAPGAVGLYAARAEHTSAFAWPASATAQPRRGRAPANTALACAPQLDAWRARPHVLDSSPQFTPACECTGAGAAMQGARCRGAPGLAGLCAGEVGEYAARGARAAGQRMPLLGGSAHAAARRVQRMPLLGGSAHGESAHAACAAHRMLPGHFATKARRALLDTQHPRQRVSAGHRYGLERPARELRQLLHAMPPT